MSDFAKGGKSMNAKVNAVRASIFALLICLGVCYLLYALLLLIGVLP